MIQVFDCRFENREVSKKTLDASGLNFDGFVQVVHKVKFDHLFGLNARIFCNFKEGFSFVTLASDVHVVKILSQIFVTLGATLGYQTCTFC